MTDKNLLTDAGTTTTTTMSAEVGSVKPNPYIFDIENRRKRKPRLAHDLGAGAKCNKCGDKCPGFELHFWRKICMNCRCGKDDHDVQDDDEDIGKVVIGKLFERPARTKKEELEFSYGNNLDMVNEETGKPEKVKFDWVPPNTERNLAARYMALLPPEKRPVAGSEAAKERRKQLEQQIPLYDMDASQRCENMPTEELQSFEAYMERIRTQVAGQGIVQEIAGMPSPSVAQPLQSHLQKDPQFNSGAGNIAGHSYPGLPYKEDDSTYAVPYTQITDQPYQQKAPQGFKEFMGGMIGESGRFLASSDSYGVAPAMSQPLRGLGQNQGVPGITAQLSGLQTGSSQQGFPSPDSHKDQLIGGPHAMKGPHQHIISQGNQALSPGRDTMIHRYQMGGSEPGNSHAYGKAGVLGSHRPSQSPAGLSPSKEGGRGTLPQLSPREESITNKEAVQAPYDAYKETLSGSMQVAPGSDVTVLFPGESHVLRSQDMSGEIPGQKSKFSCQYCSLPMTVGDVAIFCERAGADKCWHPACFCCFTCKELLADLIYFYKDGKVYCGRHFTDAMDMPRCKACDELIFGDSWTRADNFNWHIHHYCCYMCDTPLAGQRYVPDKNGFPYCLPCHMAYQAKTCQTCEEKIAPAENRCSHRGYFYHANPQCFQCYSCKTALLGKKFKMSKNWLFCSNECVQAAAEDLANNPNPKEMPM
ncbi:Testin [Portunus trituberculatus]|uniref:Testin n=1 Tax=Portunus trituberculatus TaxID=210409 RepID=A0A5B7D5P3_PORTR|nr:Testin [Portunus trituberculatus]